VGRRRSPLFSFFVAILVLAALAFVTRGWWLPSAGYALVYSEQPEKADIAVLLAGDYSGLRIQKAAELVKSGYVPAVLVSGPHGFYGFAESDLAIEYAVKRGYPREWFIPFPNDTLSTREEAAAIVPELHRRGVRSFLLVTSDYHTARARRIYIATERGAGPAFRTVAARSQYFTPDAWWKNREGEKTVFFEWSKTIATALGK